MTSVILFNALDVPSTVSGLMPDNGLAALAGCLIDAGHHVEVFDIGTVDTVRDHLTEAERRSTLEFRESIARGALDAETIRRLEAFELQLEGCLARIYQRVFEELDHRMQQERIDLLGIKLWYGPGLQESMHVAHRLIQRHPGLHVAVGGPMAALMPETILRSYPFVESLCVGEGEETIVGLAEYCEGRRTISGIPNLMTRDGTSLRSAERKYTDLAAVPAPAYDPQTYPAMKGSKKFPIFYLDDSRGCKRNCPFCAHRKFTGPNRRALSGKQVVAHMDRLSEHYGARAFRLSGSSTPRTLYLEIAEQLSKQNRKSLYSGFAYVNEWQPGDAELLARSGLVAVFTGIESGSESVLRTLGKNLHPRELLSALRRCMDAKVQVCGSIIFPSPGETEQSEQETEAFLLELFDGQPNSAVTIQPAFPQPGSRWWDHFEEVGFAGSRADILADLTQRRSRRFLPATHFMPLPYSLDGHGFSEMAQRTARLCRRLQSRGVLVGLSDDTMLTAIAGGYSIRDFARINREVFLTGDADRLVDMIEQIRNRRADGRSDRRISSPASSPAEARPDPQPVLRC